MKITSRDCLALLRKFDIADESSVPRQIERLEVSNPSPINTLAIFRYEKHRYAILLDETAQDDVQYVESQIMQAMPNSDGVLLENPRHIGSHGAPYQGKDAYLYKFESSRQRLDIHMANNFTELSRSSWQKQIRAGYVSINGQVATSPKQEIDPEDTITFSLPERASHTERNIPIVYIDEVVIVVDKPEGVLTHSKNELDDEFTVEAFFARYCDDGMDEMRHGVVHRLDRDTSGVMIGARTPAAYEHLKHQFSDRKAHKTYIAVIAGTLDQPEFVIDLPIARHKSRPGMFRVDPNGKSAQTKVSVLKTNGTYSLLQLEPRTGRTHQLRVHLAHIGKPIYGDRLYGAAADRMYLHAHILRISTTTDAERTFTSPIPTEFDELIVEKQ